MTGIDTNVLVRYFVRDDPDQAKRADEWVDQIRQAGEKVYINWVVLCELVWVLTSVYKYPRQVIADTVEDVLNTVHFELENRGIALTALHDFRRGGADFADCLIGRVNASVGCAKTVSFDQGTRDLPGLEVL
jgi:predicted nucleic-acid-binding protein